MSNAATIQRPRAEESDHRPEVTDALLADMTRRIVEAGHPYKVILFGSYAYGTPHKDSDIDLFLIAEASDHDALRRAASLPNIEQDILLYTPERVETRLAMGDFFVKEILEKGQVLYDSGTTWEPVEPVITMTLLEEWIQKAEEDYTAALALNRQRKFPLPALVAYHCQQCAEKYLKAYLIQQNATPKYTHRLEETLNECVQYDSTLSVLLPEATALSKYGVDPRYPGMTVSVSEAQTAIENMRRIRRVLRRKLNL